LIGIKIEEKTNNMKVFLIILVICLIVGSFFAGTKYSENKMITNNNERDSIYKYKIDSLKNKSDSLLVEFYSSRTELVTLKKENKRLKDAYEKEKNDDHTYVFNSPIDSTIKYWTNEFSTIREL